MEQNHEPRQVVVAPGERDLINGFGALDNEKMRKRRMEQKLSRAKLGKLCRLSDETIRLYELGQSQPLLTNLRKVEIALKLRPGALIRR
jgi:DNA-binding XRE family transcriptional regulator